MPQSIYNTILLFSLLACGSLDKRDNEFALNNELFAEGTVLAQIDDLTMQEASGLVASTKNPGYFWTHNDSGDTSRLFLINQKGQIKAQVLLEGVDAIDWEEITIVSDTSETYIIVADIGDNQAIRSSVSLLKFIEPEVSDLDKLVMSADAISTMQLTYKEGARDAESLFWDRNKNEIVLITKREENVNVYSFAFAAGSHEITRMGTLSLRNFTAADMNQDGEILIKNYQSIFYWGKSNAPAAERILTETPQRIPYQWEPQGEAICWSGNKGFYTLSERGKKGEQQLFFYTRKLR
jgi:hypothetical protein